MSHERKDDIQTGWFEGETVAPVKPDKRSSELAATAETTREADGSANPQQPASLRKMQRPGNDDHSLELRLIHLVNWNP
jgi:hypothetical protein